jgi:TonB-dependent receptor
MVSLAAGNTLAQGLVGASAPVAEAMLDTVTVTASKAALANAQDIKYDASGVVDAIVAEDVLKFPDHSVGDALQRVTGIQITRDRGDSSGLTIRGLSQVETTLNGREVFTAGFGRGLDVADIPVELISAIEVYKTPGPEQIEGGLGGTVDLRTHRPFDFADSVTALGLRWMHGSQVNQGQPQYSLLLSRRWANESGGEFGALVSLSHQARAFREDAKNAGSPTARTDLIAGQSITVPNGTSESASAGERTRDGLHLAFQWRPSAGVELYAEGGVSRLLTRQDTYQINVFPSSTFAAGSVALFPGTNDLQSITWTNAPVSILSFARDTVDRVSSGAVGGSWQDGPLTLKADLSHASSFNSLYFAGPTLSGTVANFTQDLASGATTISGTDMLDPNNFTVTSVAYRYRPFRGKLSAARFDAEYELGKGFWRRLSGGLRLSQRTANNGANLVYGDTTVNIPASSVTGLLVPYPYSSFLEGRGVVSLLDYLAGGLNDARDPETLRSLYGINTPLQTSGSPTGVWRIREDTRAAYVALNFASTGLPLDGALGLRLVNTTSSQSGNQSVSGVISPIDIRSRTTDWLPSAQLRFEPSDGWVLRATAHRSITRPDFNLVSPSITLTPNSINPLQNQGTGGNPYLRPIRGNNIDVALERYVNPNTALHATFFFKQVDGFITTLSQPELIDGVLYQVSRPRNSDSATIRGIELGYKQFYEQLPGWLGGLGLQVNYTYVDSRTPSALLGQDVPLQNLSKNSYNVIGMYERGPHSARLAYNWRGRFLSSIGNYVGVGALPIYTAAYGWLDASYTYRINKQLSITFEGHNLLKTVRRSYYGSATRPQSIWTNDLQLAVSLSLRL